MARGKKVNGVCHICGVEGKLSFEHIPPEKAYNDRPIVKYTFDKVLRAGLDQTLEGGRIVQQGAGDYTLCPKCNNDTGSWYGPSYIEWVTQGIEAYIRYRKLDTELYVGKLYRVYPLRVLKQIVTIFFSVNGERFQEAQPNLVKFVLDKERMYLTPSIKVYCYIAAGSFTRQTGIVGMVQDSEVIVASEFCFPPFGYVMTFSNSPSPNPRLVDITSFAGYDYNDEVDIPLLLPVLPAHLYIPFDYRTKRQIVIDRVKTDFQTLGIQVDDE